MENLLLWFLFFFAVITLYRILSRRAANPKFRVAAMLRRYHALERAGLSEQESLLQLLVRRRDWRKLPHRFLLEIVSRFRSKENVMRFISLSEDHGYHRDLYPGIAKKVDLNTAMTDVACLFARFGFGLQAQGRFKEAEFVQKLALQLQPDEYFTTLPLAATYHETGRHADALPLFEQGLARAKEFEKNTDPVKAELTPAKCLAPEAELTKLRNRYNKLYQACLKAAGGKTVPSSALLTVMELFG